MPDAKEYVAGSSSLVLGCDSYTSPTELGDNEFVFGQNVTCRGGIVQTRPGSETCYCMPDGNLQGFKVFTPDNGVAHHVFAVDGAIYVSAAPFRTYRRLWNLQFSKTARYVSWAVCLKSTTYDNEGALITLDNPYSVLVIQDGLARSGYWDGSTSGHLNPGSPPYPDNTDTVPGYNETPIGLWMIWSGNRLWVSRGNQLFASDIGNPLSFTEALYLNEGRSFYLSGPCTGIIETADRQGIIAFTENEGTFFQSSIQDRPSWLDTPEFQRVVIPNIGCVAPRSLTTQYGLTWWFGPRGFTNINAALRVNVTSRIDYQDNEMFASKAYLGPDLSGICAEFYENYLMVSVPSGDVLNRHTWVMDQAPFEDNAAAWPGIWTGWRPVEWGRGLVNGSERVFFASIDYDGKNRVWEAMLPDKRDNGCAITCYVQLRDHAAGDLNSKRYEWTKIFLSQIYGDVDLNLYVASTKGSYQLQKSYHLVASEGQIFADTEYSEVGPFMIGNSVQSRVIRTPSNPDDNECNSCGVESKEGNIIDYAFSHLLVWSGQMGIRAYQMHMRESPERNDGDCEENEVGPRTLNAFGCSGLDLFVDGQIFETFTAYAEGTARTLNGGTAYIRRTSISYISAINAQAMADCAVQQIINLLQESDVSEGVYDTNEAEIGNGTYVVVSRARSKEERVSMSCESLSGVATLCGYSEYADPSVPPKKYLRQTLAGQTNTNVFEGAGCGIFNCETIDAYSGNCVYDPSDCSLTIGAMRARTGSCSPHGNFPGCDILDGLQYGITPILTKTTKSYSIDGLCHGSSPSLIFTLMTSNAALSDEDTEGDAMSRADKEEGADCVAYRQSRGAGEFGFAFSNVVINLECFGLTSGSSYRAKVEILEENYGGGGESISYRNYIFVAISDTHQISDSLTPSSGKQLTAKNPEITML